MTTAIGKFLPQLAIAGTTTIMLAITVPAHALGDGPRVSLFPKAVTAELAVTRDAARQLENGMSDIVQRMKKQKDLFQSSNCEGDASNSTGCNQLRNQLSKSYIAMLDKMAENLPEVKRSVQNTELMLQKRIASELGRKRTPDQLQKLLLEDGRDVRQPYRGPTTSGRSMSAIFERQFRMISQTQEQSMISLASEIYLDVRAASGWIERLEAQMIRQKQMAELTGHNGLPPEMDATVAQVTALVLGEGNDNVLLEAPIETGNSGTSDQPGGDRFTM